MIACATTQAEIVVPVGLVAFILGAIFMLCLIQLTGRGEEPDDDDEAMTERAWR